jgi:hypothetical protein
MTASVITFPLGPLERNTKRHFDELFARMRELNIPAEQQQALLLQTLKECGLVEIDGVWQMPPDQS